MLTSADAAASETERPSGPRTPSRYNLVGQAMAREMMMSCKLFVLTPSEVHRNFLGLACSSPRLDSAVPNNFAGSLRDALRAHPAFRTFLCAASTGHRVKSTLPVIPSTWSLMATMLVMVPRWSDSARRRR